MKYPILIFALLLILYSCGQTSQPESNNSPPEIKKAKISNNKVKTYHYDSLTIPYFFKKLIVNHTNDFCDIDGANYSEFCIEFEIDSKDSANKEQYYTFQILHDLFTSQNASNCSKGDILDIPYFWHWIQPNPRHKIYFVKDNILLKNTKPPKEFYRYNSYADIDRTPFLYLSDLVEEIPKYYSKSCDTFSTFGWCSEREMAFVSLLELINYKGKVVAEGAHSWSEFLIPMVSKSGKTVKLVVIVDNTFNSINWRRIEENNIQEWKKYYGDSKQANWYNQQAHSKTEIEKIKNHFCSHGAMARMENKTVMYLDKRKTHTNLQ